MLTMGIFPNIDKPNISDIVAGLLRHCHNRNIQVAMPEQAAACLGYKHLGVPLDQLKSNIDIALTLGGDGTLLSVAREIGAQEIPICGVNLGRLGFLAEIEPTELAAKVDQLVAGNYKIEQRLMLRSAVRRQGDLMEVAPALNDVVVTKGVFSRMLRLELYIGDTFTASYQADGLIVATATGSTGYSLSAGGPIVYPDLDVVLITPICPHTLSTRPLIVSGREEIRIKPSDANANTDVVLTVDGQIGRQLQPSDEIVITKAPFQANFVRFTAKSYYKALRNKLWRGN